MGENKKNRELVPYEEIHNAIAQVTRRLIERLDQKGYGTLLSSHEVLGMITEEYHELVVAVKNNQLDHVIAECVDLAVAGIFALSCKNNGSLEW